MQEVKKIGKGLIAKKGRDKKDSNLKVSPLRINTFTAIVDLSRFNNSCLKSPASTLVDLTFQLRALRFSA